FLGEGRRRGGAGVGAGEGQGLSPAPQKLLYEILLPLSGNTGGLVGNRVSILDAHTLPDTEQAHLHRALSGEIAALSLLAEVAVVPEPAEQTGATHIGDTVLGKEFRQIPDQDGI